MKEKKLRVLIESSSFRYDKSGDVAMHIHSYAAGYLF